MHILGQEEETTLHVLVGCKEVKNLWAAVEKYLIEKFNVKLHLSEVNIILNRIVQPKYHVANFICLIIKQYIYSQKCREGSLSLAAVKTRINQIENIEKYIAIKKILSCMFTRKNGQELL